MRKKILFGLAVIVFTITAAVGTLLYNGIIWFNNPSELEYPIRGIDVSSYQGIIDWNTLSKQNIDFVFIKATEGSSSFDKQFANNWDNANRTQLKVGAYHFFSFDSSGLTQAKNFIRYVPKKVGNLPPVVDIEIYGDKGKNLPGIEKTDEILSELLNKLEEYYGKNPIIYATTQSYDLYIKGKYSAYPIWIRDVMCKPVLSDKREWTFWQYSNRQVLKGYKGQEKYIDINVYNGTKEEFENFAK